LWKTAGIADVETDLLRELENNCEKCYTLTFDTDESSYTAFTSANTLKGSYNADYVTRSIRFVISQQTIVDEQNDGKLWQNILLTVESFSIQEDELRLYYNENKNYLLLSQVTFTLAY
jgi:hypothetical protein